MLFTSRMPTTTTTSVETSSVVVATRQLQRPRHRSEAHRTASTACRRRRPAGGQRRAGRRRCREPAWPSRGSPNASSGLRLDAPARALLSARSPTPPPADGSARTAPPTPPPATDLPGTGHRTPPPASAPCSARSRPRHGSGAPLGAGDRPRHRPTGLLGVGGRPTRRLSGLSRLDEGVPAWAEDDWSPSGAPAPGHAVGPTRRPAGRRGPPLSPCRIRVSASTVPCLVADTRTVRRSPVLGSAFDLGPKALDVALTRRVSARAVAPHLLQEHLPGETWRGLRASATSRSNSSGVTEIALPFEPPSAGHVDMMSPMVKVSAGGSSVRAAGPAPGRPVPSVFGRLDHRSLGSRLQAEHETSMVCSWR